MMNCNIMFRESVFKTLANSNVYSLKRPPLIPKWCIVDLTKIHYLTGPFEVEGAEPGDILVVEIQDVQCFPQQPWGFTGVFDKGNGGGFLDEIYPHA